MRRALGQPGRILPHWIAPRWTLAALVLGMIAVLGGPALASPPSGGASSLTLPLAALLGALQGATEFLPVSSSGHLALAQLWLGIDAQAAGHRFNVVVHAGTLLAVVWLYRGEVLGLVRVGLRPMDDTPDRRMLAAVLVATLPLALMLWPPAEALVVGMEGSPRRIGIALLVTAAVLLAAFRRSSAPPATPDVTPPTLGRAAVVGVAQLLAVVPGISRSGSTIAAGLWLGLDREQAARFSFLISIPAISGATLVEVLRLGGTGAPQPVPWAAFALGFVTAFAVGLLCLRWLLALVRRGNVMGFVVYLTLLGVAAIATAG